ncbi:hypothetical protein [Rhodococcoides fascians]|uniref:hypothetical protein n=1 Tax=Rhodococcoides fascians TaxID=1828 RepID=UPI00056635D2|nr:hypothetical protein [Rhodococcus fascians]
MSRKMEVLALELRKIANRPDGWEAFFEDAAEVLAERLSDAGYSIVPTVERDDLLDSLRSIVDNFVSGDVVDELRDLLAAAAAEEDQ